jgi:hypothetical protein
VSQIRQCIIYRAERFAPLHNHMSFVHNESQQIL